MPASRTPPLWRAEFLRSLAESGCATSAAKAAGIHLTTPYKYRRRNPLFARDWARAGEDGEAAIAAGRFPPRQANANGKARPRVASRCGDGRLKLIEPAFDRWNEDKEDRFLNALMATGNITLAAKEVRISVAALDRRRKLWPEFAAAVSRTRETAAEKLNLQLIHAGSSTLEPPRVPHEVETPLVSIDQAIRIVQINLPQLGGRAAREPRRAPLTPVLSSEELVARIEETLAKLPPLPEDPRTGLDADLDPGNDA